MRARIRRTLSLRLGLAFVTVALAAVALVAILIAAAAPSEFERFLLDQGRQDYSAMAAGYYAQTGTWDGAQHALAQMGFGPPPQASEPGEQPPGNDRAQPRPFILVDAHGEIIIGAREYPPETFIDVTAEEPVSPIVVDEQTVGYVVGTGFAADQDELTQTYLARINQMLIISAAAAGAASLALGLLLARSISRPVRQLTVASRAMAKGNLGQAVNVRSEDEIGELADSFNRMSADLERASQVRRQMTADIAHELRTPLTVMAGYTEALRDGVLEPTRERFAMMHDETEHLQQLVADLRTLSVAEAGVVRLAKQPMAPRTMLERVAVTFDHPATVRVVAIRLAVEEALPTVNVDAERIAQVLGNLVSNALRYTPKGGSITLGATRQDQGVRLTVADTGSGIDAEALPNLFERFYKGDPSRSEAGGHSGLGLAIAKALVEAHGGRIAAESDGPGQGSVFSVWLPSEG